VEKELEKAHYTSKNEGFGRVGVGLNKNRI
jgi:hypothetical protein